MFPGVNVAMIFLTSPAVMISSVLSNVTFEAYTGLLTFTNTVPVISGLSPAAAMTLVVPAFSPVIVPF